MGAAAAVSVAMTNLIGRRAVYTRVETKYDEKKKEHVEISRKLFHGEIVALVTVGEYHYPAVVMLYDDGSLRTHSIPDVTVEGERAPERL